MKFILKAALTYVIDYSFVILLYLIIGTVVDMADLLGVLQIAEEYVEQKTTSEDVANSSGVDFSMNDSDYWNINIWEEANTVDDMTSVSSVETWMNDSDHWNITTDNDTVAHSDNCADYDLMLMQIPLSFLTLLVFAFLTRRTNICQNTCHGRPGVPIPVDLLSDSHNRFGHIVTFGMAALNVLELFYGRKYVTLGTSPWLSVWGTAANVGIVCLVFYPYFTAVSYPNKLIGSTIGLIFAMTSFAITLVYELKGCTYQLFGIDNAVMVNFLTLPISLFWVCYVIGNIITIVKEVKIRCGKSGKDRSRDYLDEPETMYVKFLLKRKATVVTSCHENHVTKIWKWFKSCLYKPIPGFRYSTRIISTFIMSVTVIYMITTAELFVLLPIVMSFGEWMSYFFSNFIDTKYDDVGRVWVEMGMRLRGMMVSAVVLGAFISIVLILRTLTAYRKHLLMMYRGDMSFLPPGRGSPQSAMVCCLKYSGYQVGFFVWAFIIMQLTLVVFIVVVFYQVILPVKHKVVSKFIDNFNLIWPAGAFGGVVYLSQIIMTHWLFLQDKGKTLGIDNRRLFHVGSYFLMFYNIVLGIFTCISRLLRSLVFGLIFLGRLDHSTLPRNYEMLDPGYRAYVGFLRVEEAHCHPVMVTFCRLLQHEVNSDTDYRPGVNEIMAMQWRKPMARSRLRWLVAYTMIRNPSLQIRRSPMIVQKAGENIDVKFPH